MPRTVAVLAGREPAHRYSLHRGYVDAVWAVGGVPLVFTPPPGEEDLDAFLSVVRHCDALLVSGGGDIDPRVYGETPAADLIDVDPARDRGEMAAVELFTALGRPVLGICRGSQLLAVALGGSLHQDLPRAGFAHHWDEDRQHEPVHTVTAQHASLAATALAGAERVNSIHHQAVRDPGPELVVTAWSDDGVIEAIEADGLLGVQWHPERMVGGDARHLAPFVWLCGAAA